MSKADAFPMQPVKSSNLARVGYDPATQELRVEFASRLGLWSYAGVKQEDYDALLAAPSIGAYFSSKIRPHFKGTDLRVMNEETARAFLNRSNKA